MATKKKKGGKKDELFQIDTAFDQILQASLKPMPKVKEKEGITIIYNKHVSVDAIEEFKKEIGRDLKLPVKLEAEDEHSKGFDKVTSFIILYLGGRFAEALVKKTLIDPLTDKLVSGIKSLWTRVKESLKKNAQPAPTSGSNFILIMLSCEAGKLNINIPEGLDQEQSNICFEALSAYFKSGQLPAILGNMDYSDRLGWWELALNYDIKNQVWYPIYHGDFKKRMEEALKKSSHWKS